YETSRRRISRYLSPPESNPSSSHVSRRRNAAGVCAQAFFAAGLATATSLRHFTREILHPVTRRARNGMTRAVLSTEGRTTLSQGAKKRDKVSLLLRRQPDAKTRFVKIDDDVEGRGRAVVEVRRASCESAQDGSFEFPDVG